MEFPGESYDMGALGVGEIRKERRTWRRAFKCAGRCRSGNLVRTPTRSVL